MITSPSMMGMLKNLVESDVFILPGAGAPTSGTSGTGVAMMGPGSIYIDITNGILYYNNNTKASPTWVPFSLEDVTGDVTISAGVSAIGANKITSAMMGTDMLKVATGTITSANITGTSAGQLGHANGVELVAAGGTHVINQLLSAVIIADFGVAAYTGGGNCSINIGSGGAALTGTAAASAFITNSADSVTEFIKIAQVLVENRGLNLVSASAPTNPGTAAGVLRYVVSYRQIATGL